MSRITKILLLVTLVVFTLACSFINQRVNQVEEVAKTAEAIASVIPMETLQALPSALPMETLGAIPSVMPDFGNMFNPQGEPVAEWNGIPIMPQATAGQEHDIGNYSFKFTGTTKEAQDFYNAELVKLGWSTTFSMPGDENGAVLAYQKDGKFLTITIVSTDDTTVVVLTMA